MPESAVKYGLNRVRGRRAWPLALLRCGPRGYIGVRADDLHRLGVAAPAQIYHKARSDRHADIHARLVLWRNASARKGKLACLQSYMLAARTVNELGKSGCSAA